MPLRRDPPTKKGLSPESERFEYFDEKDFRNTDRYIV